MRRLSYNQPMKRILLLEDDPILHELIYEYLAKSYLADRAYSYNEALEHIDKYHYDLFLFDINIPGSDGISLLKELRELCITTPALIITAYDDTNHLEAAFSTGAHDYLKKPFDLEELGIRIRKVLGEIGDQQRLIDIDKQTKYDKHLQLIDNGKEKIHLSSKEAKLLEYFLSHSGVVISYEELMYNIWSYEDMVTHATIRSYIRRLRTLIGKEKIKTIHAKGYIYEV